MGGGQQPFLPFLLLLHAVEDAKAKREGDGGAEAERR